MMKIHGIPDPLLQSNSGKSNTTESEKSFSNILDAASKTAAGEVSTETPMVSFAPGMEPLVGTTLQPSCGAPDAVLEQAASLLDVMEDFASALGDPRRSLKSMEPLVHRMESALEGLETASAGQDKELSRLTSEIAVTAKIETMKYHRGDYV